VHIFAPGARLAAYPVKAALGRNEDWAAGDWGLDVSRGPGLLPQRSPGAETARGRKRQNKGLTLEKGVDQQTISRSFSRKSPSHGEKKGGKGEVLRGPS